MYIGKFVRKLTSKMYFELLTVGVDFCVIHFYMSLIFYNELCIALVISKIIKIMITVIKI